MIFLPTTAGSGSDLSQFCIITDVRRRIKMSIISRSLLPNISITDPDFLATKSTPLIVDSSIDALAHAIESYVSPAASVFSENQARLAVSLWADNIDAAYQTRCPDALENLSMAGAAAGMSFSNAGLGVGHALAHALGGRLDLRHGMMHSILLPAVMRFNVPFCREKMATLLRLLSPKEKFLTDTAVLRGIRRLEDHFVALGSPARLRHVLPDKSCLREVCEAAANDACMPTNPRPASVEDLLNICDEAW